MADMFRNKDGSLTAYALACGYRQATMVDGSDRFHGTDADGVMLRAEGGAYHVHVREQGVTYDGDYPRRVNGDLVSWRVFDTLTEARRFYRAEARRLTRR